MFLAIRKVYEAFNFFGLLVHSRHRAQIQTTPNEMLFSLLNVKQKKSRLGTDFTTAALTLA